VDLRYEEKKFPRFIYKRVRFECQTKTLTYFECQTQGSSVRLTLTHWFECQTNSKFESYTRTVSGGHSFQVVALYLFGVVARRHDVRAR